MHLVMSLPLDWRDAQRGRNILYRRLASARIYGIRIGSMLSSINTALFLQIHKLKSKKTLLNEITAALICGGTEAIRHVIEAAP